MKSTNIPQLSINIEGLKLYSILLVFAPGPALSSEDYRLRAWLLHTLGTAAKQYTRARDLVLLHEQADQAKDGGVILYVLDVSEQLEGCVMALHRVLAALKRMYRSETSQPIDDQSDKFAKLRSIRNQFEHMHSQIVANETGKGPISITFASAGKSILFRNGRMETSELIDLIQSAFVQVSGLYSGFDSNSAPELGGPMRLTITSTIEFIEGTYEEPNANK